LRPSRILIASILFLCRDLLLIVAFGASGMAGASTKLGDLVDTDYLWLACSAAIPAAAILYAYFARAPDARPIVRWLWAHGRVLLLSSALAQIAVVAASYWDDAGRLQAGPLADKAVVIGELAVIGYVLLSSRVKDVFLDFPQP
jgi:hypothetical protein